MAKNVRQLPIVIDLPSPCEADWEAMAGGGQVRHCALCDKDVHLLSRLSATRVAALLESGACVRFEVASDGAVIHRGWKPGRAARVVATAALAALAACGKQLGGAPPVTTVGGTSPAASTPAAAPQLVPVLAKPEGSSVLMGAPPPIAPPKPLNAAKRTTSGHAD